MGLLVLAYFLYFASDGLRAHWAPDDMMNMAGYWERGTWWAIGSQVMLASNAYRPMGALFYLPLYSVFGLDPLPFRIVIFLILAANVWLSYRFARLLGSTEMVAGLTALMVSYHAAMGELFYRTSTVYDILCFLFYVGAMVYYLSIRARAGTPDRWQAAVWVALFVCALNSKEMAVTLPLLLLAYEWLYHPPVTRREWRTWIWKQNRLALIGIALNVIYLYGRKYGADPLMQMDAYRPVFTLRRAIEFHRAAIAELFYLPDPLSGTGLIVVALIVTYVAWRCRRGDLRFFWFWIVLTPLPIEFLQNRTHFCLYLPLLGWAMLSATVAMGIVAAASEWLSRERLLARLRQPLLQAVLSAAVVVSLAAETAYRKEALVAQAQAAHGSGTWSVIQQLGSIGLRPRPSDRLIFLNDPYEGWDMLFIAELTFHQRGLRIWLQNKTPLPAAEVDAMDHVFRFDGWRMTQVK